MKVAIRADASRELGHGHVTRCLALADALARAGAEVVFLCQQLPGDAVAQIRDAGFLCWLLSAVRSMDDDADQTASLLDHAPGWDWLVVDHYSLRARWGLALQSRVGRILVIDDLANRLLHGDVLLDQNFHPDAAQRYAGLVAPTTLQWLGPQYALLRPAFAQARAVCAPRDGQIRRVLVCFGGSDSLNASQPVLDEVLPAFPALRFDVVAGAANPHVAMLQRCMGRHTHATLTVAAEDMPQRMVEADLFIGAGGSMTWERAALALPGITVAVADNQRELCQLLHDRGEGFHLGGFDTLQPGAVSDAVRRLLEDTSAVREMGRALATHCDGRGAERVASAMLAMAG